MDIFNKNIDYLVARMSTNTTSHLHPRIPVTTVNSHTFLSMCQKANI